VGLVASRTMLGGRSASGADVRGVVTFCKGAAHAAQVNANSPVTNPDFQRRRATAAELEYARFIWLIMA
jgi:hypothetical protein